MTLNMAALSWFLDFSAQSSPPLAFVVQGALGMVILGALALACASLVTVVLLLIRRASGRHPEHEKLLARSFALLSLALFLGTIQGVLWNRVKLPECNRLLLLVVSIYLSFKGLTLVRFLLPHGKKQGEELSDHFLRFLFMIGVDLGLIVLSVSAHAGRVDLVIRHWMLYVLFCEILPGAIRLPWLLRPYRVRDLASPFLPLSRRIALGFLVLTALVPCGGLAVPIWLQLRDRLEYGLG